MQICLSEFVVSITSFFQYGLYLDLNPEIFLTYTYQAFSYYLSSISSSFLLSLY